jgi:hypothetical protein
MYKDFREMPVWSEAIVWRKSFFRNTADLPKKEDDGLTSQLRGAAVVFRNIDDYSRGSA